LLIGLGLYTYFLFGRQRASCIYTQPPISHSTISYQTRMWAYAQRDGRPGNIGGAKLRHLCTIAQLCRAIISSQLRHVSTIRKKNLLNSNISPTCLHNMVNFGLLTAEIGWWVWGTPANFNGFRVLASLLHRHRSTEINQTLYDVWPSPGRYTVHFRGLLPLTEFCQGKIHFASKSCVLLYWQRYCTALEQWALAKLRRGI